MYLRGFEQILLDLVYQPEIAEYIFQRLTDFYLEYARRTFEAAGGGLDIFMTGDDFGTQTGLFMSPDMWRRFLRPGFQAFIALGKRYGCKVAHHSCGSIKPIIPDLIECGLDILNPVQPEARNMDCPELKRLYQCRCGARRCKGFEALGPGGGFIFCTAHNIQSDTPLSNVEALFAAYRDIGRY